MTKKITKTHQTMEVKRFTPQNWNNFQDLPKFQNKIYQDFKTYFVSKYNESRTPTEALASPHALRGKEAIDHELP